MTTNLDSLPYATRGTVLGVSAVLFFAALLMPAMYFEKEAPLQGLSVLAQGWLGLLMLNPSWLANPLYVLAAVQFVRKRYARATLFCGAAIACALCSLLTSQWYFSEAAGTPIASLGIAFYAWLAALVVLLLGSLRLRRQSPETSPG
ncbi:MAG: hypothetical protein LBV73_28980 [Paraburkholderia sp.]|jgi:hypothetical protein|nr:hypothetical protein [Paraburkholderia sp.]